MAQDRLGQTDGLGRRDRFKRTPLGKRLLFTARDRQILQWLYRYRFLRQDHLLRVFAPRSVKRFKERLGDLFHETGFINRPLIQAPLFDARATPMLYEISTKGMRYLEASNALPLRAVTFSRRPRDAYSPQFLHTMQIIETLLMTELETMNTPGQRFVPVDEILARAPEKVRRSRDPLALPIRLNGKMTKVIPDALYCIQHETGYRFYALECERTSPAYRSTTNASSTAKKQAAYAEIRRTKTFKDHWSIPNLELRLVTSEDRT